MFQRLVSAFLLLGMFALLLSATSAQSSLSGSPEKRLNIVPTAEEMQRFQREELKKKLEAFRQRVTEEFEQRRPKDAASTVIYVDEKKTWFEAEDYGRAAHGTDLVSVPSETFNTSLGKAVGTMASNPKAPVWIGLRRPSRYFVWSDSTPYFYGKWRHFTPWKEANWRNCVSVRGASNHRGDMSLSWVAEDCWRKRRFACWKKGKKPTEFSVVSRPVKPHRPESIVPNCPMLKSERVSALAARQWCSEKTECIGYRLHSVYTQIKLVDSPSYVRFYKKGAGCSQTRLVRGSLQNFVFIQKGN